MDYIKLFIDKEGNKVDDYEDTFCLILDGENKIFKNYIELPDYYLN